MKAWQLAVIVAIGAFIGALLGASVAYGDQPKAEDILKGMNLTHTGVCFIMTPETRIAAPCERYTKDGKVYVALRHPDTGEIAVIKELNEKTHEQKNIWVQPQKPKGQVGV